MKRNKELVKAILSDLESIVTVSGTSTDGGKHLRSK